MHLHDNAPLVCDGVLDCAEWDVYNLFVQVDAG